MSHPSPPARASGHERGQASVELVSAVPAVLVVGLVAWQFALTGQAAWLCANAARVAARAAVVGGDAEEAARSALPATLAEGLSVQSGEEGVRVKVAVPLVFLPGKSAVDVEAAARLGAAP